MRGEKRQSSIEITVVDLEAEIDDLFERSKAEGRVPEGVIGFDVRGTKFGFVETPKGVYLLDHEACGRDEPITDDSPLTLEISYKRKGSIPLIHSSGATVTREDILGIKVLGTENFADLVRTFGGRIEDNFRNWNRHLQAEIDAG